MKTRMRDQDAEHDRLRPVRREVPVADRALTSPMISAPRTAPWRLPIPPSTAAVNEFRPKRNAERVHGVVVVQQLRDTGRAGQDAADQEGDADRAVDVDAHQAGGIRDPAPSRASPCPAACGDTNNDRAMSSGMVTTATNTCDGGDLDVRDPERLEQVGRREDAVDRALVGAAPDQADVLQDVAHADRRDEGCELRRVAQRSVGDPLDERRSGSPSPPCRSASTARIWAISSGQRGVGR